VRETVLIKQKTTRIKIGSTWSHERVHRLPSERWLASSVVSRCWIEATLRMWGLPPLIDSYMAECGSLSLFPPEVAYAPTGAAATPIEAQLKRDPCSAVDCGDGGVCLHGQCVCYRGYDGPLCSINDATTLPPSSYLESYLEEIVVSPNGTDAPSCGGPSSPCATIQHALQLQYRYSMARNVARLSATAAGGTAGSAASVADEPEPMKVVLLEGSFLGIGNRQLTLHGNRLHITSARGPASSTIDCSAGGSEWGALIARGETDAATVSDLTLRKCVSEAQAHHALATHPAYSALIAGASHWPAGRRGAVFLRNVWEC